MKKEEKTRLSRERILKAALEEFGTKGYENASLNSMCAAHQISKGLLYHNFENKDALFLACAEACYRDMTEYLKAEVTEPGDVRQEIQVMMDRRQSFFRAHPWYSRIFFQTVLQPPVHLQEKLREIRRTYDEFNAARFRAVLERLPLRKELSMEQAMGCFFAFQEMYNAYFRSRACEADDFDGLIRAHEVRLSDLLDILLYGIVSREGGAGKEGHDLP